MLPIVLSQGNYINKKELVFTVEERGLQFGDGVYEVIRIYNGKPFLLKEHINRLFNSLKAIKLYLTDDLKTIITQLETLILLNKLNKDGIIYLQVTRGIAPRQHGFPTNTEPTIFAYITTLNRPYEQLKNGVPTITYRDERWSNCSIKSINLLPNILAKQVAIEHDCYEAILIKDNIVTEGTSSNIFIVKNHIIYTHPATECILRGCTRNLVIQLIQNQRLKLFETTFSKQELISADEVFMTSTTVEILPIVEINDHFINNGKPGPLTKQLQEKFNECVDF